MTEKTGNIDWLPLLVAIALAPAAANILIVLIGSVFPPLGLLAFLFAWTSLCLGYTSYLMLGAPLMILAYRLGEDHPILHAGIGYGAVWLIPLAQANNLPMSNDPSLAHLGQWFAPLWCATAAIIYNILRHEFTLSEEPQL